MSDLCLSSCFDNLSLLSSYLDLSSFLASCFNSALDAFNGGTSTEPQWFVERDVIALVAVKTSKMLGSVSEGAVDEECMAEAK